MAYKSLLTVLTDIDLAEAPIAQGISLADANNGHLDVLALGVDRSQAGYYYAGANAMILQETLTRAHEEAEKIESFARSVLDSSGIRWGTESGVTQIADLGRHVAQRARFADMVILPKPYGDGHGAELEPTIEAALFEGQTPVLVVPDGAKPLADAKTVSVAWH